MQLIKMASSEGYTSELDDTRLGSIKARGLTVYYKRVERDQWRGIISGHMHPADGSRFSRISPASTMTARAVLESLVLGPLANYGRLTRSL
jgi:hypothetical protein